MSTTPFPGNSLVDKFPSIAAQWHPAKNDRSPDTVCGKSGYRVWWLCESGHEWEMTIASRTSFNSGCPVCSGRRVDAAGSIAALYLDLMKEAHPTKNAGVDFNNVSPGTSKKFWWRCGNGHEWESPMVCRTKRGAGCPTCNSGTSSPEQRLYAELHAYFPNAIWRYSVGRMECDIMLPSFGLVIEYDGAYWHLGKEKTDVQKNRRLSRLGFLVMRVRQPPLKCLGLLDVLCPKTESAMCARVLRQIATTMPVDPEMRSQLIADSIRYQFKGDEVFFALPRADVPGGQSLVELMPDLAGQWSSKNSLTPRQVSIGSRTSVWWICPEGHEWKARVAHRANGIGCPYCSGRNATPEINLATSLPKLAAFLHPTKNDFTPALVTPKSNKVAWWICPQGHEWEAKINNMARYGVDPRCRFCEPFRNRKNPSFSKRLRAQREKLDVNAGDHIKRLAESYLSQVNS